ncbi:MAG: methionyl-tRNA formyltransferase [Pirellulales bacterium]|nr:methionyl-tRNA formyltransferase [Pirellulales bacterium]
MRLIMMGTGPFARPTFEALYATRHEIVALVTQPLRPAKGKSVPEPSPLRAVAERHGTPIFDPEPLNTDAARDTLRAWNADLFVVADYGQILAAETLATARLGGVNLHGSLLPRYRGAAPINWAIYHGETAAGVSVIHMTPRIDAGPVLAQASLEIGPDETAVELEQRLAALGAPLICEVIDRLDAGHVEPVPQDPAQATRAPRLKKTDGAIDWSRTAQQIKNQVRALEPWPKTYTTWHKADGSTVRLILGRCETVADAPSAAPGTVVAAAGDGLVVATGQGGLRLVELQPSGKRLLPAAEFLRGYRVAPGERFGPETASGS